MSLNTSNSSMEKKRIENMNMKLFSREQSLVKTTEITQANPCKNAAFTILTIVSN